MATVGIHQLVELFERVGLKTNCKKTVSMTCRPCSTPGNSLEETYGHTMTGEGLTPRERKRERVECGECGKEMAAGSLDSHCMTQNGMARERKWAWTDAATVGGGAENVSDGVPQGGDNGLPSRRVPREGRYVPT